MLPPVTNASEPRDTGLTHFDASGQAHMVDVADKAETRRVAVARGHIRMQPATLALIRDGHAKKGDVLGIARIAAIQAAKRTSDLIPLCHPLPLTRVTVHFALQPTRCQVSCTAQVETLGRTGVEMEALTAVQVGLLTIYDMCKAVDRGMVMGGVRVDHKSGGKSGDWSAPELQAAAVRVFVRDLPQARAFYGDALALPLQHDATAQGWCVFDGGGVQLILEAMPADAGPEDAALVGRLTAFSLAVDDLASTHARLAASGVVFMDAPQAQPWGGQTATLQDPSGNTLQLVQYPD